MIATPNRTPCAKPQPIDPKSHSPRNRKPPDVEHRGREQGNAKDGAGLGSEDLDLAHDLVELGAQQRDVGLDKAHEGRSGAADLFAQA